MKRNQAMTWRIAWLILVSGWVCHVQAEPGPSLAHPSFHGGMLNEASGKPGATDGVGSPSDQPDRPRRSLLREMEGRPGAEQPEGEREREGPEGRGPRELSQEQIKASLEILREQNPELARRMGDALEQRPELAQRLMASHWPRLERLIELKKNNPKLFRLTMDEFRVQRQMFEMGRKLRQTSDTAQKDELRKQLREQAGKLFDLRMKIKEAEVDALEKRLTEMRDQLKQTRGEREDRIAEQLKDLEEGKTPMPPAPPHHRKTQRQDQP